MQISGLPAVSSVASTDVLAIEVNGVTYKVTAGTLATMLQAIGAPLPVDKGGSGLIASPALLTNLASANATGIFQANPRPGVTGVLGLVNGGLGKDFSAAGANAGFHNSIFRGKNLGTSLTSEQSAQITAGTFDDLFVGDYWTIGGVNWRIAACDQYYRCGDNISLGHHAVVVPDTVLYNAQWNETNDTSTGYIGSAIRANIKGENTATSGAEAKVIAAFGASHVLSYRDSYPTTYSGGKATNWAWTDARVELLNEVEVYGSNIWSSAPIFETAINKSQLPLFRLAPQFVNIRAAWWLRTVYSAAGAARVYSTGDASGYGASGLNGVRPFALIA